jgi:ParB-like chromosome segregation protein Spo0J
VKQATAGQTKHDADRIAELERELADERACGFEMSADLERERAAHERTKERMEACTQNYSRTLALRDAEKARADKAEAVTRSALRALARIANGNEVAQGEMLSNMRMMRIARALLLELRGAEPMVAIAETEVARERALAERVTKLEAVAKAAREFRQMVQLGSHDTRAEEIDDALAALDENREHDGQ